MKANVIPVLAAIALATAGCGGSEDPEPATTTTGDGPAATEPAPLSAAEARMIDSTRAAVDSYCVHVGVRIASGREPIPARFDRAVTQVEQLVQLARAEPLALAPDGSTPRFALGDIAEDLEGSNCDPRLARRIDEALAALPAE